METTSVVKEENGPILICNDNEVFVMNYDIDEHLCENEPTTENNKLREPEPVAKEVISEMEEHRFEEVDIKEEDLQVCHGKNNSNKKSNDKHNDKLKEDKWYSRSLKRNLETADPEKKMICAKCGFRAMKKHHLASHIQLAHPPKQPPKSDIFECEYCMFSSRYRGNVSKHMSRFHMDKVLNTESQTPRKKKSSFEVQSLMVEDHVTLGDDGAYNCNYCAYSTPNKNIMKHHIVIHIVDKRPVKQCPHCPLKYTETVLFTHIQKIHNPEGVFNCPKCHYVTKFPANLRRHIRKNAKLEKCVIMHAKKASLYTKDPEVKKKSMHAKKASLYTKDPEVKKKSRNKK